MTQPEISRWAAFTSDPDVGNPAGVAMNAGYLTEEQMVRIAQEVGFSETAFIRSWDPSAQRAELRYFSPHAEVPFCGHATLATAVALATETGPGDLRFVTPVGEVELSTREVAGQVVASFTSVEPWVEEISPQVLTDLLDLLGLSPADLNPEFPPRLAYAGNIHPVVVLAERSVFDGFSFDPDAVRALMDQQGWAGTVTILWAETPGVFQARNLFPVGEITEDPATGSAAASTGAYLRKLGLAGIHDDGGSGDLLIRQGVHVGRPSQLQVGIPVSGGITVTGAAVALR